MQSPIEVLIEDIEKNDPNITKIQLNTSLFKDIDLATFSRLFIAFGKNEHITNLSIMLKKNGFNNDEINLISEYIENNTSLTALTFSASISIEGMKRFTESLAKNNTIKSLSFLNRNISDEGMHDFAAALSENTSITSLSLSGCRASEQGIIYLAKSLEQTNTLKTINFEKCTFETGAIEHLRKAMELNTSIISFTFPIKKHHKAQNDIANSLDSNRFFRDATVLNNDSEPQENENSFNKRLENITAQDLASAFREVREDYGVFNRVKFNQRLNKVIQTAEKISPIQALIDFLKSNEGNNEKSLKSLVIKALLGKELCQDTLGCILIDNALDILEPHRAMKIEEAESTYSDTDSDTMYHL